MQICVQTTGLMKVDDLNSATISLRLSGAEAVRYHHIMTAAMDRNPFLRKTDVIRELVGLESPQALTKAEIDFFRTGKKEPQAQEFEAVVKPKATVKDEQGRGKIRRLG